LCKKMQLEERLAQIPVIFLTAKADIESMSEGFEVGGVDYITKPFYSEELIARVRTHLQLYLSKLLLKKHNLSLEKKVRYERSRLLTELEFEQKEIIYLLMELLESVSDETGQHTRRVAELTRLLAQHHPALSAEDVELLYMVAPMHDLGKILVECEILHKQGKYTPEDYEKMKLHTVRAKELLKPYKRRYMKASEIVASQHHEHWDGSGYPQGLKGEEIHLYARIVAVADVFDALLHKRSYKEAWPFEKVIAYVKQQSGKQFDPKIVEILIHYQEEVRQIFQHYKADS